MKARTDYGGKRCSKKQKGCRHVNTKIKQRKKHPLL
jgi:hypothetical protein